MTGIRCGIALALLAAVAGCGAAEQGGDGQGDRATASVGPSPPALSVSTSPTNTTQTNPASTSQAPTQPTQTRRVESGVVPDVAGVNHQLAQDTMQAAGFYNLSEEDATGQGSLLINDRNWVVVSQQPKPGTRAPADTTIILRSKKPRRVIQQATPPEPVRTLPEQPMSARPWAWIWA